MTSAISSAIEDSAFLSTSSVIGSPARRILVTMGSLRSEDDVALKVECRRPARGHDTGRVVLLDDQRAGTRRRRKAHSPDDRRLDQVVVRTEPGKSAAERLRRSA